jgi:hypothetical protein
VALGIKISYMIFGLQIQNRPARRPGKGSRAGLSTPPYPL